MTITQSTSAGTLTYRLATLDDKDLLLRFREECGWGGPKIHEYLGNPDRPFCIFILEKEDGEKVDVGMGGWALDMPDDQETASRKDRVVYLSSLFIRKAYQSTGLGSKSINLLEKVAIEEHKAETLTLDTTAYHTYIDEDGWTIEDKDTRSKNCVWYEKKGYREYKDPRPQFPNPSRTDPNRKLQAVFLRRPVAS
ncbi:uncharacterized protein I303_104042 [Kwoniella dejecticola CBS 10117]|uniref:N-acetyltransferase domain-containing protein n=1 Tax=Kwoniella dejecticola CBS 10117 TaxID=1296121 RepID=A0A1A6A8F4_9TREE|nr:uncharacterized protein I303_04061 [Kwoniella dejecticola CBS 10117]OBR86337.1 hypothetical protein I303_04061 [Kwoniella dejecticola CBS 10117]